MSGQYAPKTFLRQVRPEQFRRYFKQLGITSTVDLELLKRPNVEPAYQWIQSLPPEVCRRVESDFTTVCEMATEQGTQALLRAARDYGQDWSKILGDDHNHYERAFCFAESSTGSSGLTTMDFHTMKFRSGSRASSTP